MASLLGGLGDRFPQLNRYLPSKSPAACCGDLYYRQGEAIRRNGEFITPDDIVRVFAEHPAVTDVCVYGIPAHSGAPGEQDIVAAVVPTDRTQFDPASLFTACRHALAAQALPAYLQVVSALPKTLSEKPQTRLLREHFDPAGPDVFTPSP